MQKSMIKYTGNGFPMPIHSIPEVHITEWRDAILNSGGTLSALFGQPLQRNRIKLWALVAFTLESKLGLITTTINDSYPALTPDLSEAHLFEREIFENFGVRPLGHPWLKPVRYPNPSSKSEIGITEYFQVEGSEVLSGLVQFQGDLTLTILKR